MDIDIEKLKKSEDLALFLGMFAGDGCLSIKHDGRGYRIYPITFYNTNKEYVCLFGELFFKLFNIKGSIRCRERKGKLPLWEFEKYSVKLYTLINNDLEISNGKKALSVKVPSYILTGSIQVKKQFFLGLLITDGGIRADGTIIFHSASEDLLIGINTLIKSVWGFNLKLKSYIQRGKFKSYQLTLNKGNSSEILENYATMGQSGTPPIFSR